MENTLKLTWILNSNDTEVVARYCSHCGKVVNFSDSGYRRQNANGKTIFHFAIFKCEKDHTWNKKIEQFTASGSLTNVPLHLRPTDETFSQSEETFNPMERLHLPTIKASGYKSVQIEVSVSGHKQRLDKVLKERFENMSRSQLVKHIETGTILVDGAVVKGKTLLHHQQVIEINLEQLNF